MPVGPHGGQHQQRGKFQLSYLSGWNKILILIFFFRGEEVKDKNRSLGNNATLVLRTRLRFGWGFLYDRAQTLARL